MIPIIIAAALWLLGLGAVLCLCRAARMGDEQMERLDAERRAAVAGDDGRPGKEGNDE